MSSSSIRVAGLASFIMMAMVARGHADSTNVVNRDVLRQMVQLSVAFTQARISYTSPPYPVQFVNTSPFAATAQGRPALGPIVNPTASQPNNNFFIQEASHLQQGHYTVVATTNSYVLTNTATGVAKTFPIPPNVMALLPTHSVSGSVEVQSTRFTGPVFINYTLKR